MVLLERCGGLWSGGRCEHPVFVDGEAGGIVEGRCEGCGMVHGMPAHRASPQMRRERMVAAAGLPDRFAGHRFEETAGNREALRAVREWLAGIGDDPSAGLPAPALFGAPGVGKSHLLAAIVRRLIDTDRPARFWSVRGLLRAMQRFDDPASAQVREAAVSVPFLALDDVGAQQQTDWRQDQLADLIDERYERERPVLLATNFPPSAWGEMVDARTASRLRGMTFPLELRGTDRRQVAREAA